jgi:serine/threonine protein kinase
MLADAPSDPLLTYDPVRASILKSPAESTILETAEVAASQGPSQGQPVRAREQVPGPLENFLLSEPLAQGGLGDVWVAVQRSLDRVVAVKRLRVDRLEEASFEQRKLLEEMFRQEALTTARLEHPNIVPVYALGSDSEGQALLGMKMVRGQPWDELVREHSELPLDEYLSRHLPILIDVAQAVAYAHSQGILHRDIKPQQVMVGEFGEVLLMDWGLAIPFGAPKDCVEETPSNGPGSGVTTVPGPAGTPSFMAPEQARGNAVNLGPWTDLYLLGGTLYFLLTGSPPHQARNGLAAMAKAARGELQPPQECRPERKLPAELCELTLGVMATRPEERYPRSVPKFIEALQAYLSGANRRRQSLQLTEEVEEQLASSRSGVYSEFSHSLSRLQEAETLWPENPKVPELRDTVLCDYAEAALLQGDLALARVQAVRLPEGRYRGGLLRRIERTRERQRTSERQRRRALNAMAFFALLLLAGGIQYLIEQRRAGERLRRERDTARIARAEAEGLMTFMLEDLWSGLMTIDRTDLLTPVARRAANYYASRDVAALSPTERRNRGHAFATVADALHLQGDTEEAIEAYRQGIGVFAELMVLAPQDLDPLFSYVSTSINLAWALNDVGNTTAALATYDDAEKKCQMGIETHPESLEMMGLLLALQDGAGIVFYDRGDLAAAGEQFREAAQIGHAVLRRDPTAEVREPLAMAEFHHAVVLIDSGQPAQALVVLERTFEIAGANQQTPSAGPYELVLVHIIRARALAMVGRTEEGLLTLRRLAPRLEQGVQEDPANAERRYLLTQLELENGNLESLAGNLTAARVSWQKVVDLVEPYRETTDNLYLLDSQVRALFALGRVEKARPVAEKLLRRGWTHNGIVGLCGLHGVPIPSA